MKKEIIKVQVGAIQTNCYLIKENGHVLIVDPGANAKKIFAMLQPEEVVDAVCLTHGHFDHVSAADQLSDAVHCPIYIYALDEKLARDKNIDRMGFTGVVTKPMKFYQDGINSIGAFEVDVIHTPGHTDGSVCLKLGNDIFSGDTIFKESVGRCDLYSGSEAKMRRSLNEIQTWDAKLNLYPGHGESTTLSHELQMNPYLN